VRGIEISAIRGVVFDAVGTLIYAEPPVAVAYHDVGRRYGSRKTCEEVGAAFRKAFAAEETADLAGDLATSEHREQQRWRTIVAHVLDDADDAEACFRELYDHFAQPNAWRVYADAEVLLERLLDAGRAVGIASNFDARLEGICRADRLLSRCAAVAISAEVGFRKPHAALFRALEERMGLECNELLHVGDDLCNDYRGAQSAGWQSVLLLRSGATSAEGVCTVRSLAELRGPLGL
jgi:putative hydrolase of the HAD superfamily